MWLSALTTWMDTLYVPLSWDQSLGSPNTTADGTEARWGMALMRGFCHQAGAEPEPNVDCGVLESDKTKQYWSRTQLTAPNLRPDHSQTPSTLLPPRPHSLTAWVMIKSRERERECQRFTSTRVCSSFSFSSWLSSLPSTLIPFLKIVPLLAISCCQHTSTTLRQQKIKM